jgi:hypothetical protein
LGLFLGASVLHTIIHSLPGSFVNVNSETYSSDDFTWLDCLYAMVVMLSTLGFGDIVPQSAIGKLYVIFILATALSVIPYSIGQIMDTYRTRPVYMSEVHIILYYLCIC